jgi:hypothetical protein
VRSNIKIARRTKKRRGPVLPSATASMRKGQGDKERMRGGGGEGRVRYLMLEQLDWGLCWMLL